MTDKASKIIIKEDTSILKALELLDETALQILLVVDDNYRLIGAITDGDVRRGVLKGIKFEEPVNKIMNKTPIAVDEKTTRSQALSIMSKRHIHQLPVVDKDKVLIGLHLDNSLIGTRLDNEIILMAGGFGKRLNELTENCPKPLLKIGSKPILETIIESFIEAGFYRFTISLGYLAHMITDYFGDGSKWGVEIKYIHETEPLGTAGALSLLEKRPEKPFLIMNGDLLTRVDFKSLLNFHREHKSPATMCVRGFEHNIPYGVVKINEHEITALEEKPIQSVLVNAGIYVLEPECLDYIPKNQFFNMTSLFEKLIAENKKPAAFPIHEYWIDIGQPEEFNKAGNEYFQIFTKGDA